MWAYLIHRIRTQLNPVTRDYATFDEDMAALRFLLSDYRRGYEYTECCEMLRRVFFIGIIPLMAQEDEQKCFIGMIFALMSIVVYNEAAPFQQPFNNVIAKAAQYVILVTFGSAVAITTGISHGLNSTVYGVFLLAVNFFLVLLIVYFALKRVHNSKGKWAHLSDGMEYHFFLDYYPQNSEDQCDALEQELRNRGFKLCSRGKSAFHHEESRMAETSRLQACEAFILFLNSYTCSLRSVQRDLSEALRLGKRVVVVRETSIRHGAALDDDGQFQLEKCCICDPHQQDEEGAFQAKLETHRRDVQEELETNTITNDLPPELPESLRGLLERPDFQATMVPYMRLSPFREGMILTILDQADMAQRAREPDDLAERFKILPLPTLPNCKNMTTLQQGNEKLTPFPSIVRHTKQTMPRAGCSYVITQSSPAPCQGERSAMNLLVCLWNDMERLSSKAMRCISETAMILQA